MLSLLLVWFDVTSLERKKSGGSAGLKRFPQYSKWFQFSYKLLQISGILLLSMEVQLPDNPKRVHALQKSKTRQARWEKYILNSMITSHQTATVGTRIHSSEKFCSSLFLGWHVRSSMLLFLSSSNLYFRKALVKKLIPLQSRKQSRT